MNTKFYQTTENTEYTEKASPQEPTFSKRFIDKNKTSIINAPNGCLRLGGCLATAWSYGYFVDF